MSKNNDKTNAIKDNRQFTLVMYGIDEVEQILGCCRTSVLNYIKSGKLKAVKIGGSWKISKDNLEQFCNGK